MAEGKPTANRVRFPTRQSEGREQIPAIHFLKVLDHRKRTREPAYLWQGASGRIGVKVSTDTAMSNCIYCGATDVSVEHPLPRALGKFKDYVPLTDKVCKRCNGICGQLDEQLCRCGSEAFFRKFLDISGRSGHDDVNSFYRSSSRGGRLEMVGINHQTGEE